MASTPLRHALLPSGTFLFYLGCAAGAADPGLGVDGVDGGTMSTSQGGGANTMSKAGGGGRMATAGAGAVGGGMNGGGAGTNSMGSGGASMAGGAGGNGAGTAGRAQGGTGGTGTGGSTAGGSAMGGRADGGMSAGGAAGSGGTGGAPPMAGMGGRGGNGAVGGAGSGSGGKAGGAGSGAGGAGSGGGGAPAGSWTNGYVATMYGDISSGDCQPYGGNFTDHTPISTYTCVLGNGPRKVTLSPFSAGVANNSSYYAALGDLSSLWQANGNASPCTCNGSTSATCGGPSCPSEISSTGSCGLCIAVKCDPNSTFKDNMGFSHNSACNTTTYVVVQNIDACPHNHTTNVSSSSGWCTDKQSQHIDLSCSGLGDISNLGTQVGMQGWLPVSVQVVDCNVGLGKHSL